jgi:CubicO group peptidase (beta-lactamase class C family)
MGVMKIKPAHPKKKLLFPSSGQLYKRGILRGGVNMRRFALLICLVICSVLPAVLWSQAVSVTEPGDVGLSPERLQRINVMVRRHVDEHSIAGAVVLLARHGKVVYFEPFGVMDVTTKSPMRRDAIFRLASMSKPIVSVAAMILYEEGKFQLDDPVSKFIPELKGLQVFHEGGREAWTAPDREMTIQDLFRHTSGFIYGSTLPKTSLNKMYAEAKIGDSSSTLQDMIRKLHDLPLSSSPGEKWEYGRSTDVLGYLVGVLSGKPLDVFLRERIFIPLRMTDTDFFVPSEKQARFTSLHALSDKGTLVVTDSPIAGEWSRKPTFLEPGGGLVSTASDYFRFAQMLLNRGELDGVRLLSPTTVDLMTTNHLPVRTMPISYGDAKADWMINGCGFGLGFRILLDPVTAGFAASVGSFGWFGFFDTFFLIDPKLDLIGIFLAQFTPPPLYPAVREFQTLMFQTVVH